MLYENGERFPTSGWLEGSCEDIADMARLLSVPQSAVNEASDHLELGIETAASRLNEISELRPKVAWEIANLLGLSNVHQTRRMACAILANAMVFHDRVADMHDGIEHLYMVCGPDIANPQAEVLDSWQRILKINYWPIFAIARDILSRMSPQDAARILHVLRETAGKVSASGASIAHDLTGRIFPAPNCRPQVSRHLLHLAVVSRFAGTVGSGKDAGYRLVGCRCYRRIEGSAISHVEQVPCSQPSTSSSQPDTKTQADVLKTCIRVMMEEVLYGCDVMPSAIHITGANSVGSTSQCPLRRFPTLHLAVRTPTRRIGSHRIARTAAILIGHDIDQPPPIRRSERAAPARRRHRKSSLMCQTKASMSSS